MKIAVVTGSRAEYGLLHPLAKHIWQSNDVLQLMVTGSHLSPAHGYTVDQISLPVSGKVECVLSTDTETGICKGVSLAVAGFSETYERLSPDVVIVLGDRYEILAAAIAAHIHRIPIAHVHGGEVTGNFDNAFRHSITKMASLHFTATETYRKRVIQLGEHPDTVFNVGALGTQGLKCRETQLDSSRVVILYHPETLCPDSTTDFWNIIEIVEELDLEPIFIKSNADNGSQALNEVINSVALTNGWCEVHTSLDRDAFLLLLLGCDAIIGNSSAGIIEAPALGVPTINIGRRQEGRLKASSIIDVERPTAENLDNAFARLYSKDFQDGLRNIHTPYGKGDNVAGKIFDIIKERVGSVDLMKGFYDVKNNN